MIYFVQSVQGGHIKIGTSKSPLARKRQLETEYQTKMVFLRIVEGGFARESEIHSRFDHVRIPNTEWFEAARVLLDFIDELLTEDIPADLLPMDEASVRLPPDVVALARRLSGHLDKSIANVIADAARENLKRQEREVFANWKKELGD